MSDEVKDTIEIKNPVKIITKGDGAGGSTTNKNGLLYEKNTCITNYFTNFTSYKIGNKNYKIIDFDGIKRVYVEKKTLEKFLKNDFVKLEKSLQPDEALIDIENKKLYILEKKFQQVAGSTDEKIQTGLFKKQFYEELYPSYKIHYAYVLNDWYKAEKYKPELRFLKKYDINVFWSNTEDYYENIKNWIIS